MGNISREISSKGRFGMGMVGGGGGLSFIQIRPELGFLGLRMFGNFKFCTYRIKG